MHNAELKIYYFFDEILPQVRDREWFSKLLEKVLAEVERLLCEREATLRAAARAAQLLGRREWLVPG